MLQAQNTLQELKIEDRIPRTQRNSKMNESIQKVLKLKEDFLQVDDSEDEYAMSKGTF